MKRYPFVATFTAALMMSGVLFAQDESAGKPLQLGDFDNHGEATVGYRFIDVRGYRPQFQQMFNLRPGLRLNDFSFFGTARENTTSFADQYSFTASGIGGDPFPAARFMVSKKGLYDLRVNWRQSYYYWNQNDDVSLPITSISPALSKGLTNYHDWATVRKFGSADFTLHATKNLQFTFETGHTSNDGTTFTTRSLDFFNSPSYWASFARANPYYLVAPLQDTTDKVAGGVDYTRRGWSFHYKTGYQIFNEDMTLNTFAPNETSIDPVALSLTEPLNQLSWSQSRRLTTPISEFSFAGKLSSRLAWRGSYIYNRYRGPAVMDQAASGLAPGSNGVVTAYAVSESGRTSVIQPSHAITEGFTYEVRKWWDVDVDYRYLRFTSESVSKLESLLNGTVLSIGGDDVVWRDGLSELSVAMDFRPNKKLTIHPGIRLLKSDIESLENGIAEPTRTLRTNTVRPEIGFSYKPWSTLNVRGDFRSSTRGASYTAITPHTRVGGRFMVRYQPIPQLSVENSTNVSNSKLLDANFESRIRANSTTVSYARNDQFSLFGGLTYDSFFAAGNIIYPRGTPPLRNTLRDQEINRVWQAGLEFQPMPRAGLRLSGNYIRTTGEGRISGEPPAYGPLKWPMVTGTFYFNFPKAGRLSIDLQRTYYVEELVPVNNFSANILTLRWTRSF